MVQLPASSFSLFSRRQWTIWLTAMQEAALGCSIPPTVQTSLFLVRDRDIALLNADYLDCPGPTNILSFPFGSPGAGELFLSVDALRREALLYGQNVAEHACRLLAHGFAHLLGLDHGPDMDSLCETLLAATQNSILDG
jgi:probable rRNA maturation factor